MYTVACRIWPPVGHNISFCRAISESLGFNGVEQEPLQGSRVPAIMGYINIPHQWGNFSYCSST
jgi:hypothetical protein